ENLSFQLPAAQCEAVAVSDLSAEVPPAGVAAKPAQHRLDSRANAQRARELCGDLGHRGPTTAAARRSIRHAVSQRGGKSSGGGTCRPNGAGFFAVRCCAGSSRMKSRYARVISAIENRAFTDSTP